LATTIQLKPLVTVDGRQKPGTGRAFDHESNSEQQETMNLGEMQVKESRSRKAGKLIRDPACSSHRGQWTAVKGPQEPTTN
jgi:hypothetical protein